MSLWDNRSHIKTIENVIATVADWFVPPPSALEARAAATLRDELRQLSGQTGIGASPFWQQTCQALLRHAENGDPRFFMRWPPIKGTMVNGTSAFTATALSRLRQSADWQSKWKPAITHRLHGHGPPFLPYPWTNGNTIMHAAHLCHFKQVTGRDWLDYPTIIECGGGYGSMCRLVQAIGFTGRYTIFDLPPVQALQRYFLTLHGAMGTQSVLFSDSLQVITAETGPRAALMSTWALSEMPLPLRDEIVRLLENDHVEACLLAYQHHFEGTDNVTWFRTLTDRTGSLWDWRLTPIDASSDYLVGIRR